MRIARSINVSAPSSRLWTILAQDYAEVGRWARAVQSSAPNTAAVVPEGATFGGRVCAASIGAVTETITTYDTENCALAYNAKADAMPFFVRGISGRWKLIPAGKSTEVDLIFEADLMFPFNHLIGWAIRRQFTSAIDETLEDLRLYAETGTIHPDKQAALAA